MHTNQKPETHDWPPRLRREELARYLLEAHGVRLARQTLARMAVEGSGPPYALFGRVPLYPREGVNAWVASRLTPAAPSAAAHRVAKEAKAYELPETDAQQAKREPAKRRAGRRAA